MCNEVASDSNEPNIFLSDNRFCMGGNAIQRIFSIGSASGICGVYQRQKDSSPGRSCSAFQPEGTGQCWSERYQAYVTLNSAVLSCLQIF